APRRRLLAGPLEVFHAFLALPLAPLLRFGPRPGRFVAPHVLRAVAPRLVYPLLVAKVLEPLLASRLLLGDLAFDPLALRFGLRQRFGLLAQRLLRFRPLGTLLIRVVPAATARDGERDQGRGKPSRVAARIGIGHGLKLNHPLPEARVVARAKA